MSKYEDKTETKRMVVKLAMIGIGVDVIVRLSIWLGLDVKLKNLVHELKN